MNFKKADFIAGLKDAWPMFLAYVPIAMLWGTLAAAKGFSSLEALLMSALLYAGASQFVAIEMWVDPPPLLFMVFTIFIINVRHVLYAASISRHMGGIHKRLHPLLMYVLTDEAWAILERVAKERTLTPSYFFGVSMPLWPTWSIGTFIGAYAGRGLGDVSVYGLDFAFPAMFIAVVAGFWKGPKSAAIILVSAAVSILAKVYISGAWYILLGGLAGMLIAIIFYREDQAE